MDEYSGQRSASGYAKPRRGSGVSFRDSTHEDGSVQSCNRLRCNTRLNSMKSTSTTINQEKAKYSKPSFHSSSYKTTVRSSSKSTPGMNNFRKPHYHERQQRPALLKETIIAESSKRQDEVEAAEPIPSSIGIQIGQSEEKNAETVVFDGLNMNTTKEVSNTRPQKQVRQSGSGNPDSSIGSSIRRSTSCRNTNQAAKPQGQGAIAHQYGLRNIGCASINDIIASSSSSDTSRGRINMIKRRSASDGESSAARGKKTGASSSEVVGPYINNIPKPSLPSAEHPTLQPASRRTRNWSAGSSSFSSVRTQRAISWDNNMSLPKSENDNVLSVPDHVKIPLLPLAEFSINEPSSSNLSRSFRTELPGLCQNSLRQPGSSNGAMRSRPRSHNEGASSRPFHSFTLDQDGFQHFNMEGIAEVLLALERIEQDEELSYEQLLILESNLFLGGLSFHDQHRDMRLDIDNMSYEELLALEEKMGNVSTALSEQELSNCLKKSLYVPVPHVPGILGLADDDIKCSICQEEYALGDDVGKLQCEHRYHVSCIQEWLRQKNWCPICKTPSVVQS